MNKEKLGTLLDQYSEHLKKYGIYMLVVLLACTLSLGLILNRKNNQTTDRGTVAEVKVAATVNDGEVSGEKEENILPTAEKGESSKKQSDDSQKDKNVVKETKKEKASITITTQSSPEKDSQEKASLTGGEKERNFLWPVKGKIINEYGWRYSKTYGDYRFYTTIDIKPQQKETIKAAASGKVILVQNSPEENTIIQVDHGNGCLTYYSHLTQGTVKEGQRVEAGEKIGEGGFIRFGLKENQQWVNPLSYLK